MSDSHPSPAGDCTVVIFGATGDLARRKLLPALVNLAGHGALPDRFTVLGVGRTPMSDEAYRQRIAQGFEELGSGPADPALWTSMPSRRSTRWRATSRSAIG
jgi:glucose-6-phosphate 1-dehydrogenase